MPEGFGARLRKQREERQIDLSWVAEQTKIKRSLLEALERDDVSQWPSGIFRRAYVRTYAHIIGLDPDVVVREFLQVHPEPVDMWEAAAAAAFEEEAARRNAPGVRLRTMVDSAIGSLAKLRRPGAIDGTAPARPLTTPVPSVFAPPAAPDGSAVTTLGDAAESEELLLQPPLAGDAAPSSLYDAQPPPYPILEAADDKHEQASASAQEIDAWAGAASGERRVSIDPRLEAVAYLCTELGRARGRDEIVRLLEDSARALDAIGLIVWLWDESSDALRPALVHGYSDQVLAHLPTVRRDADNATAEAFRSARPCEVPVSAQATGALVVPLLIPEGCAGVLAVELQPGIQAPGSLRALATALAAALAQFVHRSRPAAQNPGEGYATRHAGGATLPPGSQ